MKNMKKLVLTLLLLVLALPIVSAGEEKAIQPGQKDKCPVCGMFVAKYKDFLAQIVYKDGSYAVFDGPKDFFKYYLARDKYSPGKKDSDIDSIYVTDYYTLTAIDGRKAFYVLGSDIYGPMGRELIPFLEKADALEFMKDHNGNKMLQFQDVNNEILQEID